MRFEPRLRPAFAALGIAAAACAVYLPALRNGFAYDDVVVVQQDARIRSLGSIGDIFTGGYWQNADLALYRPVTTLSFALDHAIGSGSAAWFHASNLLLHAAVSVLAFFLLARLFGLTPALAGALLFAVHPVHVEAVGNIVGRAEMLSAGFVLGACLLWIRPRKGGPPILGTALLFALGLLSKESAVMLPVLLVLLDMARSEAPPAHADPVPERSSRSGQAGPPAHPAWLRTALQSRAAAFVALALVLAGYLWLRAGVLGAFVPGRVDPILEVVQSPLQRVFTALQAWPVWMRLLFIPDVLLADYGPRILAPALSLTMESALGLILLLATVLGGLFAWRRGERLLALGLLWFPVTILPVSNLIVPIGVLVAERTLYLPSFVMAFLVAGLASFLATRPAKAKQLAAATLAIALLALSARTLMRVPDWASTDTIMAALVRDRPDAFRGRWHAARKAAAAGEASIAMAEYDTAIVLWPYRQRLVLEAIGFAAQQREYARAFQLARHAARHWPGDLAVQRQLAGSALDAGDFAVARRAIEAGLRLSPGDSLLRRMAAFADSAHGADR